MNKPFTDDEAEIMTLLVQAHHKFVKLPQTHPSDVPEWVVSLHRLQDLLAGRVLRREFPETFPSITEKGN